LFAGSLMVAFLASVPGDVLHAQAQSSLRAQQTLDYRTGRALDFVHTVGPVKFTSVEFSDLGKGYGRGGIGTRLRAAVGASEASTTLRAHFLAENPTADEWDVAITLELLDRSGMVIERVTRRPSWEGEAKPYDFDAEILEYVVPMIARVRLTLEARVG
jgi:hypothetical protein